jgi:hypothetical protein
MEMQTDGMVSLSRPADVKPGENNNRFDKWWISGFFVIFLIAIFQ